MSDHSEATKGEAKEAHPPDEDALEIKGGEGMLPEIDAGAIYDLDPEPSLHSFDRDRHYAETTRTLAFWLIGVLVASVLIHYSAVIALDLTGHSGSIERLEQLFHLWLPIISGLASAATTYYFTKDK